MLLISTFQSNRKSAAKDQKGQAKKSLNGSSSLANPSLVPYARTPNDSITVQHQAPKIQYVCGKTFSSDGSQNSFDDVSIVRTAYIGMKISPEVVDVIMTSWRKNTLAKYKPTLRRWYEFCSENGVNIVHPNIDEAMSFLVQLSRSGHSYSQLCTARSALSSILWVDKDLPFGEYPIVKRLMKGFFECKPTFPRFYST